jgi:hypothetical protein
MVVQPVQNTVTQAMMAHPVQYTVTQTMMAQPVQNTLTQTMMAQPVKNTCPDCTRHVWEVWKITVFHVTEVLSRITGKLSVQVLVFWVVTPYSLNTIFLGATFIFRGAMISVRMLQRQVVVNVRYSVTQLWN